MIDVVITLVFMMTLLMFSIFPALKLVEFIATKKELTKKMQNILTLFFTISIALLGALFMKFA
jgi:hypothetical protein